MNIFKWIAGWFKPSKKHGMITRHLIDDRIVINVKNMNDFPIKVNLFDIRDILKMDSYNIEINPISFDGSALGDDHDYRSFLLRMIDTNFKCKKN